METYTIEFANGAIMPTQSSQAIIYHLLNGTQISRVRLEVRA